MHIRLATVVLLAALHCGIIDAAEKTRVDVYISDRDDSALLLRPGKVLASGIFDQIGVRLVWHSGELPMAKIARRDASVPVFSIRTVEHHLESATSGALASARIVGSAGTEIAVYKDRLQSFLADHESLAGVAAGYVLAHELAHVMQGIARHSESGIMKANWSRDDRKAMVSHQLTFTRLDIELIHRGLAAQRTGRPTEPVIEAEKGSPAGFNSAKR